jgi:hypothetical protein
MIFLRHALVLGTFLLTALASPTVQPADAVVDWDLFHRLVDNVDESSIHSILHKLAPKFKHGVFSKDRSAIEQVHSENPLLATSLLSLARRQSNTTTTQSSNPSSAAEASSAASVSSEEASISSAVAASALTASTVPAPTSLALAPTTPNGATAVTTQTGEVVYSSSGGGLVTVASSIAFVTYQRSSQEVLSTYTLPNGQLTTATSVVVVNAPVTGSVETAPGTAGAAQTTGGGAGLQSGAACASQGLLKEMVLMLGGAAVVAMAL